MRKLLVLPATIGLLVGLQAPADAGTTCAPLGCASATITGEHLGCSPFSTPDNYKCRWRFGGEYSGSSSVPNIRVTWFADAGFANGQCSATAGGCGGTWGSGTYFNEFVDECDEITVIGEIRVFTTAPTSLVLISQHVEQASVFLNPSTSC